MTSILTNTAAAAALQTLRFLAGELLDTQKQVSTGFRVGTATDNAAYWSIATTMRSDNGALSAVQDALGLGAAQVDTAYSGMESSIAVVQEMKRRLVAASDPGVDKAKIQEEIGQLQSQLSSIASSASFSGENWLQAGIGGVYDPVSRQYAAGDAVGKQVVGSFARDDSGAVSVRTIGLTLDETNVLFDLSGGHAGLLDQGILVGVRDSGMLDTNGNAIYVETVDFDPTWEKVGDLYFDDAVPPLPYVEIDGAFVRGRPNMTQWTTDIVDTSTQAVLSAANYVNEISVSTLDITRTEDYRTALQLGTNASDNQLLAALLPFLDRQLEKMINAAADLGSVIDRIGMQQDFVSKFTDSIDRGVGRLVDADMNEASTRLKALQTQQQLATQSLSIANTNPESIMALFRQ